MLLGKRTCQSLTALVLGGLLGSYCLAEEDSTPVASVPRLVKFSVVVKDIQGKPRSGPLSLTFSIYADQEGGEPLWSETQKLNVTFEGHYEVLLGASTSGGLPPDLFSNPASSAKVADQTQGRWLGIQIADEPEQSPRVLLVSVPYALKAADAEKLGGRAASEFVLADQLKTPDGLAALGLSGTLTANATNPASQTGTGTKQGPNSSKQQAFIGTAAGGSNLQALSGTTMQFTYSFLDGNTDLPSWLDVQSIYVNRGAPFHISEVYCEINGGAATINLQRNGQNILSTNLTCTTTGAISTSFASGLNAIAFGDKIAHQTVTIGSGLRRMNVVVKYAWD